MVTEGVYKVIGGGNTLLHFLVNSKKEVATHLHPEELKPEVDKFLNWFQSKMRPETQRLVRLIVPAKVLGGAPTSAEDKQKQRETLFGSRGILNILDKQLESTHGFVCGKSMTIVDVLFYCEISTILSLSHGKTDLGADNHALNTWFHTMKATKGMAALDGELSDIVTKFDLAEK